MIKLIADHLTEIRQLCKSYDVETLELFGSAAEESDFNETGSDVDFLVGFAKNAKGRYAKNYFAMLEALKNILGREVDLVMPDAVSNKYFLESINKTRKVVYAR